MKMQSFILRILSFSLFSPLLWGAPKSYTTEIRDYATFESMADRPVGVVKTGKVIKFLIDNRQYPKPAQIYFINGRYCEPKECPQPVEWVSLHRTWAEKSLKGFNLDSKQFNDNTYYSTNLKDRQFIAGRLETFEKDGQEFFGVWFVEIDQIKEDMIQFALDQVKKAVSLPGFHLDFVGYSAHQTTKTIQDWMVQNGFREHRIVDLIADTPYMPMNKGEAWGFLHFQPEDSDALEPDEIPVFAELPLDLAVVAGTITTSYQDVASHVNLKSKERGTPNMVIRDAKEIDRLKSFDRQPVHLIVKEDGFVIEASTKEMVQQKLNEKINKPWKFPGIDLKGEILHYDEMCGKQDPKVCLELGNRFGGKGSRLGFLAHPKVIGMGSEQQKKSGYRLTPLGFAIPINYYKKFVDYNLSIHPQFKDALNGLIAAEMGLDGVAPLTTAERKSKVEALKQLFLTAKFPPGMYSEIEKHVLKLKADVAAQYPGEVLNKLKIRSSANVEDIEDFDGAGLHDSFSAKIKKSNPAEADGACQIVQTTEDNEVKTDVEPESIACALKATFGSLWNLRALRERTYHRFDHRGAFMGISVLPAYGFRSVPQKLNVAANSVLITRILNTSKVYGYQMSTQAGDNLVTNPNPGTISELTNMTFQIAHAENAAMTVFRYAKPIADQPALETTVLDQKTMQRIVSIARTIEEAYCRSKPGYFVIAGKPQSCSLVSNSQKKPKSLDMEIKILSNGEILFKQSREFSGK